MISDLTHLHDETKDIGIVVEKNTLSDVCIEFALIVVHDTACKIVLLETEKLPINIDLLCRKFHSRRMITLDTTKHESISEDTKLLERLSSGSSIAELLDGIEKFLVEDGNMLHSTVIAIRAAIVLVHVPVKN